MWGNSDRDEENMRLAESLVEQSNEPLIPLIPLKRGDHVAGITRLTNNKIIVVSSLGRVYKIDAFDAYCVELQKRV